MVLLALHCLMRDVMRNEYHLMGHNWELYRGKLLLGFRSWSGIGLR